MADQEEKGTLTKDEVVIIAADVEAAIDTQVEALKQARNLEEGGIGVPVEQIEQDIENRLEILDKMLPEELKEDLELVEVSEEGLEIKDDKLE